MQSGHGTIATRFTARSLHIRAGNVAESVTDEITGGFRTETGLRGTICGLPDFILGEDACVPLMIFIPPVAIVGFLFTIGGVRNPMVLSGAGIITMAGMSALILPGPIMVLGFIAAAIGVTALMILVRR